MRPRLGRLPLVPTALALLLLAPACQSRRSAPPPSYPPPPGGGPGPAADQQVPGPVRGALDQYVQILATSRSLEEAVQRVTPIAGGGLVNEDGRTLRNTVPPYSLKKDWQNVRFYVQPPRITRVQVQPGKAMGFGPSAIRGTVYKVWIAKREGQAGMPAPISIMLPEPHPFVNGPRIVGIGSL